VKEEVAIVVTIVIVMMTNVISDSSGDSDGDGHFTTTSIIASLAAINIASSPISLTRVPCAFRFFSKANCGALLRRLRGRHKTRLPHTCRSKWMHLDLLATKPWGQPAHCAHALSALQISTAALFAGTFGGNDERCIMLRRAIHVKCCAAAAESSES
jgi:hypothetical protein